MNPDRPPDGALSYAKGHGTGNDFVLLDDPDGRLRLDPALVRAICDRHTGLGADGVLRVVRCAALGELAGSAAAGEWFLDYRNADGSCAEMCGNGARVYAKYLVETGRAGPGPITLGTRAGPRQATVAADGTVSVDLGPWQRLDRVVTVAVAGNRWPATPVFLGNPHLVVRLGGLAEAGPLQQPPDIFDGEMFSAGANVEFVVDHGPGGLAMRVFERGVGETRSCGTGAAAAVVAALGWRGHQPPATVQVRLPGGPVAVTADRAGGLRLTGPVALVAWGWFYPDRLAGDTAGTVPGTGSTPGPGDRPAPPAGATVVAG